MVFWYDSSWMSGWSWHCRRQTYNFIHFRTYVVETAKKDTNLQDNWSFVDFWSKINPLVMSSNINYPVPYTPIDCTSAVGEFLVSSFFPPLNYDMLIYRRLYWWFWRWRIGSRNVSYLFCVFDLFAWFSWKVFTFTLFWSFSNISLDFVILFGWLDFLCKLFFHLCNYEIFWQ